LKTLPAQYGPPLCRPEGDGRVFAALRATGARLSPTDAAVVSGCSESGNAFRLTILAALGFVLELFIVEEELLASGEDEIRTAVDALQNLVLEFH